MSQITTEDLSSIGVYMLDHKKIISLIIYNKKGCCHLTRRRINCIK